MPNRATVNLILHIAEREAWERAMAGGVYRVESLDREGFIHCSKPDQIVRVADARFRGRSGLVLLCIAAERVQYEIRYEGHGDGPLFPHIYGPLNVDAVVEVLDFAPGEDGRFALPPELRGD